MRTLTRWWSIRLWTLAALGGPACGVGLETDEASQLAVATTLSLTVTTNAPSWPRQICFHADGGTPPYLWNTSWAGHITAPSPLCVTVSSETCNIWAEILQDTPPPGGLPRSSDPATVDAIDTRDFSAPPGTQTLPLGGTAFLYAPAPHASRHCDGQGTFYWEHLTGGSWLKASGTDNTSPVSAWSSTAGSETYRVRCDHPAHPGEPDGIHVGTSMTVNWASAPTCSLSCVETGYPTFECTVTASGGVGPYSYFSRYDNGTWQPNNNPSSWICKYKLSTYTYTVDFKARDAAGTECSPTRWTCGRGGIEL